MEQHQDESTGLSFLEAGSADAEVLVFVHGAGASAGQFTEQVSWFSRDYHAFALSLRGHGDSWRPESPEMSDYTIPAVAGDVIQFLDVRGLSSVHFVGNSAGGVVGYEIARTRPDLLRSLVTFGTTGRMAIPRLLKAVTHWYDRRLVSKTPEKSLRSIARYTSRKTEVQERAFAMFLQATESIPWFRQALAAYDYLPVIRSLPVPYLILRGEYDKDINRFLKGTLSALQEQADDAAPGSRVVDLPGAGHLANLDAPEAFKAALAAWLLDVRSLTDGSPAGQEVAEQADRSSD
ncbi:MAG: alpha/beta hydrolase [Spirochaetaceae bacterium]|nr:MAG: alpha/beta hydrolase [Spirochaetaceae bacterium]